MKTQRVLLKCDNCHTEFVVSKITYYRRIKESKIFCTKCHINLIGKFSEKVELGRQKQKQTLLQKYGVDNPVKSKEIQDKMKATCLKKYGCEWQIASSKTKEKIIKSNIEKHGVKYTFQDPKQKEKTRKILIERYGVDNPAKSKIIQEKMKTTHFKHYGVDFPAQCPETRCKQRSKIKYDGLNFDSNPEVIFYAILKKSGVFFERQKLLPETYKTADGKEHHCIIDFYVNGVYYELKGPHLFENDKPIGIYGSWQEKYDLMMRYNVHIIRTDMLIYFLQKYLKRYENVYQKD